MMKNYTKDVKRDKNLVSFYWTVKASLLLVLMVMLTAQSFANPKLFQSLSLDYENAKLYDVLDEMKSKTKFHFFYDVDDIKENKTISISAKNLAFEEILNLA